jgi:hypothetical protein
MRSTLPGVLAHPVKSSCVINLCEDKGRVFEEAYRALKEGGRLSISDMLSDKPFPVSWRSDPERWAGCVHAALPEQEYLDPFKQAGFTDIKATRRRSGGAVEHVQVYSLSVSARKGPAAAVCGSASAATDAVPTGVIPLLAATAKAGCCGGPYLKSIAPKPQTVRAPARSRLRPATRSGARLRRLIRAPGRPQPGFPGPAAGHALHVAGCPWPAMCPDCHG